MSLVVLIPGTSSRVQCLSGGENLRELIYLLFLFQRLAGATLLVFANKQDLPGALSAEDIKDVSY
jgi:signal recognition particle receptor subunit beta